MVFAGLKPDVTFDLDLFVDEQTLRALLTAGFGQHTDDLGQARIMVADAVEVVISWPGVLFEEVFAKSGPQEGSRGLRVASLQHVLAFKTISSRARKISGSQRSSARR